ncbi:MAG: hypothetical protein MK324_17855 [Pirellulales bacterium]|nr:hypothetical protein [Pirellulales bacterium]
MFPKSLEDRRFQRYLGPVIGLIAGAFCGLQNPFAPGALPVWITVAGGALIGGIAGILVMVLDPLAPIVTTEDLSDYDVKRSKMPSSLVGRVLSLFGLLLSWIPFLGLVLNLIGVLVNRGTDDWAMVFSKISLTLGLIVSVMMLIGLILGW